MKDKWIKHKGNVLLLPTIILPIFMAFAPSNKLAPIVLISLAILIYFILDFKYGE